MIPQIEAKYYGAVFLRVGCRGKQDPHAVPSIQGRPIYVYRDETTSADWLIGLFIPALQVLDADR
jgi:hypothetical protein